MCKKNNASTCLGRALNGDLIFANYDENSIDNSSLQWFMDELSYDTFRIRNKRFGNSYIHHEYTDLKADTIKLGWLSAQWKVTRHESNNSDTETFKSVILDKPQSFNWYRGCVTTAMTELFVWFKDHGSLKGNRLWNPTTFNWTGCNANTNRSELKRNLYSPRPVADFFADGFGFPENGCGNYRTNFEQATNQAVKFLRAAGFSVNDGSSDSWQVVYIPEGELETSTIKDVVDSGIPFIMAMDSSRGGLGYNPEDSNDANNHAVIVYGYKEDSSNEMTVNVMLGWHRESGRDRNTLKLFQKEVPEYALLVIPPNFANSRRINRASATRLALESFGYSSTNRTNSGLNNPSDLSEASSYLQGWIKSALNHDIVHGYPDGLYRPNKLVNRVEFLKMVLRAAKINTETYLYSKEPPFADLDNTEWYYPYVKAAYNLGIIKGTKEGLLLPSTHLSEREGVLIVNRTKQVLNN